MSRASSKTRAYDGGVSRARRRWQKVNTALQATKAFAAAQEDTGVQRGDSPVRRPDSLGTPLLPQDSGLMLAENSGVDDKTRRGNESSFAANLIGATLSCFLTATGGISLGTVIFPPNVDPQWLTIGMNVGLLTAFVANAVLSLRTNLPVAVGGTLIPAITVLSEFMNSEIGPTEPDTVLAALAVNTFCFGVLVFLAGKVGVNSLVKSCPYAVFVGFLGYTGLSLLVYSVQIVDPKFSDIADGDSYESLFHKTSMKQVSPPVLVAVAVAMLKRDWSWKPQWMARLDAYLVPIVALCMTGTFYATIYWTSSSTDDVLRIARSEGWVFDTAHQHNVTSNATTPSFSITDFTHVWTVRNLNKIKWNLLASSSFATLVLQTFAIGCLTLVEDAFATAQLCSSLNPGSPAVDIDEEVQTGGVANMILALTGGLPANVVFSYSATVVRIGASNRVFYLLQALMSLMFFVFGNQIVSVMPKMIPSFLLFWVGLDLSIWALWDLRPHHCKNEVSDTIERVVAGTVVRHRPAFDRIEYFVVITMALVGTFQGSGLMMVVGLLFAFAITLWRMRSASIVSRSGNLTSFRSSANRPANDVKIIESMAERTQIIVLARTSLSFHNVSALADMMEQVTARASAHVKHCIIDFAAVLDVSFDSCQTFAEIVVHANTHNCQLIFTGLRAKTADALVRAGVPIIFGVFSAPLAAHIDGDDARECVFCPIQLNQSGATKGYAELDTALALCEDDLLFNSSSDGDALTPTDASRNQDQEKSRHNVVSAFPELNEQAVTPVIVDVYNWSNGYFPEGAFEMGMLRVLSQFMECHDFSIGECIYKSNWALPRESTGAPNAANTPPLVWLLRGAIEHRFEPNSAFGETPKQIAKAYNVSEGTAFETAEVDAASVGRYAVGPLGTHNAFFACMPHCGVITAVARSTITTSARSVSCAILTREKYDSMRKDHPDVANLLMCHCARKRWTALAKTVNDGCPTLVL